MAHICLKRKEAATHFILNSNVIETAGIAINRTETTLAPLPSQHGIWMSSENVWIHHKTSAIHEKCHFLWCLGMSITAEAHSTASISFWSNKGFMVPFSPTLETRALDIFGKWHYVRELKIR